MYNANVVLKMGIYISLFFHAKRAMRSSLELRVTTLTKYFQVVRTRQRDSQYYKSWWNLMGFVWRVCFTAMRDTMFMNCTQS